MSMFVDPNFDTYSLDSCAQYGIISFDPCKYLTGKPSPYLSQYYPTTAPMPYDSYVPTKKSSMSWKAKALTALALIGATIFTIKKPHTAKKIIPQKLRTFIVKHTPEKIQKGISKAHKYLNDKLSKII